MKSIASELVASNSKVSGCWVPVSINRTTCLTNQHALYCIMQVVLKQIPIKCLEMNCRIIFSITLTTASSIFSLKLENFLNLNCIMTVRLCFLFCMTEIRISLRIILQRRALHTEKPLSNTFSTLQARQQYTCYMAPANAIHIIGEHNQCR